MRLDALRPGSSPRRPAAARRALRWRTNEKRGRAPQGRAATTCCQKMVARAPQTFAAGVPPRINFLPYNSSKLMLNVQRITTCPRESD